jgi:hypothetical protein
VHGFEVYSAGVGPKGTALLRFPVIKKELNHPTNNLKYCISFINIFCFEK